MVRFDRPAEKLFCENCGKLVNYQIISKRDTYNIRGEEITITAEIPVCENCDTELLDVYLEDKNLRKAYKKYAEKYGLVTADEIKSIREKYGLNQEVFARILGIGRATLARYENGSLANEATSSLIKRSGEPEFLLSLVEERKNNIAHKDYERIKKKLKNDLMYKEIDELESTFKKLNKGNIDYSKLYGTVACILSKLKNMGFTFISKVRLMKFLWFIDSSFYDTYGTSITGLNYAHLPMGPTPHHHETLLEILKEAGVTSISYKVENDSETIEIRLIDRTPSRYLTDKEKRFIENVVEEYAEFSTSELIEKTHEDERWKSTKNGEMMTFK